MTMVGVLSILILLIIFTTVGFVFAWMVHLMARSQEQPMQEAVVIVSEVKTKSV
jgi:hypothetical protein